MNRETFLMAIVAVIVLSLPIGGAWVGFNYLGDVPVDTHLLIHGELLR